MDKIQDLNNELYITTCNSVMYSSIIELCNDTILADTIHIGINYYIENARSECSTCKGIANDIIFEIEKHIYKSIRESTNISNVGVAKHNDILSYANNIKNKLIIAPPTVYTVLSIYGCNKYTMIRDDFSSINYMCAINSKIAINIGMPELEILSDIINVKIPIKVDNCEHTMIKYGSITL